MSQPLAIYASIPFNDPAGPLWLSTGGNIPPVTVANPFPFWPNLNWTLGGIVPQQYSEIPQYLWSQPVADPTDGTAKTFTRRLTAANTTTFNALNFPKNVHFRLALTIAADDEYIVTLLKQGSPLFSEEPIPGFNFGVPPDLPWRNVKNFVYGSTHPISFAENQTLDIKVEARNVPQPPGTPPDLNPAMFTWILYFLATST